jgi:hypothetical protein
VWVSGARIQRCHHNAEQRGWWCKCYVCSLGEQPLYKQHELIDSQLGNMKQRVKHVNVVHCAMQRCTPRSQARARARACVCPRLLTECGEWLRLACGTPRTQWSPWRVLRCRTPLHATTTTTTKTSTTAMDVELEKTCELGRRKNHNHPPSIHTTTMHPLRHSHTATRICSGKPPLRCAQGERVAGKGNDESKRKGESGASESVASRRRREGRCEGRCASTSVSEQLHDMAL